jgi:MFS family permease
LAVTSLPEEQFLSWGWRIPFLLSILLVAVGLFIRLRILESPAFQRIRESGTAARIPLVDVFKNHWKQVLVVAGAYLAQNVTFYILISFVAILTGAETYQSDIEEEAGDRRLAPGGQVTS